MRVAARKKDFCSSLVGWAPVKTRSRNVPPKAMVTTERMVAPSTMLMNGEISEVSMTAS